VEDLGILECQQQFKVIQECVCGKHHGFQYISNYVRREL